MGFVQFLEFTGIVGTFSSKEQAINAESTIKNLRIYEPGKLH